MSLSTTAGQDGGNICQSTCILFLAKLVQTMTGTKKNIRGLIFTIVLSNVQQQSNFECSKPLLQYYRLL